MKNVDLWAALIAATEGRRVIWEWVRSHNGHQLTQLAGQLACSAKAGEDLDDDGRVTKFRKGLAF